MRKFCDVVGSEVIVWNPFLALRVFLLTTGYPCVFDSAVQGMEKLNDMVSGGAPGSEARALDEDPQNAQQHRQILQLMNSCAKLKTFLKAIVKSTESICTHSKEYSDANNKLTELCRSFGMESPSLSADLNKGALFFGEAQGQLANQRELLHSRLQGRIADSIKEYLADPSLEDARTAYRMYAQRREDAEAAANALRKERAAASQQPSHGFGGGHHDVAGRLRELERRLDEHVALMVSVGEQAAQQLAACSARQQRLALAWLLEMAELQREAAARSKAILDKAHEQISGELARLNVAPGEREADAGGADKGARAPTSQRGASFTPQAGPPGYSQVMGMHDQEEEERMPAPVLGSGSRHTSSGSLSIQEMAAAATAATALPVTAPTKATATPARASPADSPHGSVHAAGGPRAGESSHSRSGSAGGSTHAAAAATAAQEPVGDLLFDASFPSVDDAGAAGGGSLVDLMDIGGASARGASDAPLVDSAPLLDTDVLPASNLSAAMGIGGGTELANGIGGGGARHRGAWCTTLPRCSTRTRLWTRASCRCRRGSTWWSGRAPPRVGRTVRSRARRGGSPPRMCESYNRFRTCHDRACIHAVRAAHAMRLPSRKECTSSWNACPVDRRPAGKMAPMVSHSTPSAFATHGRHTKAVSVIPCALAARSGLLRRLGTLHIAF
eukprot:jgi/Mesvir1/25424/Mv01706-RA.1